MSLSSASVIHVDFLQCGPQKGWKIKKEKRSVMHACDLGGLELRHILYQSWPTLMRLKVLDHVHVLYSSLLLFISHIIASVVFVSNTLKSFRYSLLQGRRGRSELLLVGLYIPGNELAGKTGTSN